MMKMRRNFWRNVTFAIATLLLITMYARFISNQTPLSAVPGNVAVEMAGSKTEEMNMRTIRMRQACSQYPLRRHVKASLTGKRLFYISQQHKLSYCRVAKVGSTFWTQVFLHLAGIKIPTDADIDSVFDLPRDASHSALQKHKDLTMGLGDKRIHKTTSFLVSRNPYSRLFSSYIDQIYLPNKWEHAGKMVKNKTRQNCGNDVTFEEFLKEISDRVLKTHPVDLHWAPVFSICLPCETNVDILAKQETFNEDAKYIMNLVGVEQEFLDEMKKAVSDNVIETSIGSLVHTYVSKGHKIKKGCISEKQLAEKIWKAFQIQGYLHNTSDFPEDDFIFVQPSTLESKLSKAILEAIGERKLSSEERKKQRQDWKVSFWKEISLKTLQKVQDAFYEDFFVFQYDMDPNTM